MHWYQDSCKDLAFVQWICTVHHRYTIVHHGPSTFNSSTALLCYSFCVLAFTLVQYKSMYLQSVCHLQTKHCSQNSIVLSLMYLEWNELLHINILSAWIICPIPLFWTLLWVERGYLVSFDHVHTPQFCVRPKIMMIAVVFQTNSSMVMHRHLQARAYPGIARVISNHEYLYDEDWMRRHTVTNHGKKCHYVMDFMMRDREWRGAEKGGRSTV